jgi:hypothetical protein
MNEINYSIPKLQNYSMIPHAVRLHLHPELPHRGRAPR